jgi:hypothetical protein
MVMNNKVVRIGAGLAVFALIISLFGSCKVGTGLSSSLTIESGQVPPDMAKEDFIIIGVLKGRKSYDKYLRKGFEGYTGRFELKTQEEITASYTDVEKYRYILDHDREVTTYFDGTKYVNNKCYRFYIYDRKEKKKYSRTDITCSFYYDIKNYVIAVDNARKKSSAQH